MDKKIIYEKIKNNKHSLTNCYSIDVVENSTQLWSRGNDFAFSYEDHGIERLVYFANDWNSVNELLRLVERGRYYLELITRNIDNYIPEANLLTKMRRVANPDCRSVFAETSSVLKYQDAHVGELAREDDAEEINRLLWRVFHTEISHLLSDDELRQKIRLGQVTVHRDGDIDAILQVEVLPKKFYINHAMNISNKKIIHAILLNRLEKYVKNGGKYLYAWVEDTNIASLKFLEKYGMTHDGMWSMIYCLER